MEYRNQKLKAGDILICRENKHIFLVKSDEISRQKIQLWLSSLMGGWIEVTRKYLRKYYFIIGNIN